MKTRKEKSKHEIIVKIKGLNPKNSIHFRYSKEFLNNELTWENRRGYWLGVVLTKKKVNKDGLQSNFSKTKFSAHELWRQKVISISRYAITRDHFEV